MKATWFFALIVACLLAFTVYDYTTSEKKEDAHAQEQKVIQIPLSEITDIQIEGQKNSFKISRDEKQTWMIEEPFKESADQQQVFTFLAQITSEKRAQTVSDAPRDLAVYGLQAPLFILTVKSANAQQKVKLGSVKAFDGSLYAQIGDQKKVILVSSTWDVILSKPAKDLRDTKLYQREVKVDFDKIQVSGKDTNFVISRVDGAYALAGSADPIYQPSVQAWLEQVKALRGAGFNDVPVQNLKPDYTITLTRAGDAPFVMKVKQDRRPEQYIVTSTDLPGGFSSQVLAGQTAMNSVLVKADVFYNKRAPFDFDLKQVTHLRYHDAKSGKNLDTSVDPKKPDLLIEQIHSLDAVRFLGLAPSQNKFKSHLTLLSSDAKPLFEMSWGDVVVEKATLTRPEAHYLPVVTSLSKQLLGVPEKQVLDLARQPEKELGSGLEEEKAAAAARAGHQPRAGHDEHDDESAVELNSKGNQ